MIDSGNQRCFQHSIPSATVVGRRQRELTAPIFFPAHAFSTSWTRLPASNTTQDDQNVQRTLCKDMLRSSRSVWKRGILPGLCNCHFYLARGFNPIKTIYVRKPNSSSNKGEHKRALAPPSNLSCCEDNGGMCGNPIHPCVASPNDPNRWSMGTAHPLKIDDGKSQVTTAGNLRDHA